MANQPSMAQLIESMTIEEKYGSSKTKRGGKSGASAGVLAASKAAMIGGSSINGVAMRLSRRTVMAVAWRLKALNG